MPFALSVQSLHCGMHLFLQRLPSAGSNQRRHVTSPPPCRFFRASCVSWLSHQQQRLFPAPEHMRTRSVRRHHRGPGVRRQHACLCRRRQRFPLARGCQPVPHLPGAGKADGGSLDCFSGLQVTTADCTVRRTLGKIFFLCLLLVLFTCLYAPPSRAGLVPRSIVCVACGVYSYCFCTDQQRMPDARMVSLGCAESIDYPYYWLLCERSIAGLGQLDRLPAFVVCLELLQNAFQGGTNSPPQKKNKNEACHTLACTPPSLSSHAVIDMTQPNSCRNIRNENLCPLPPPPNNIYAFSSAPSGYLRCSHPSPPNPGRTRPVAVGQPGLSSSNTEPVSAADYATSDTADSDEEDSFDAMTPRKEDNGDESRKPNAGRDNRRTTASPTTIGALMGDLDALPEVRGRWAGCRGGRGCFCAVK